VQLEDSNLRWGCKKTQVHQGVFFHQNQLQSTNHTQSGGWGFVVMNSLGDVFLAAAENIAHVTSAIQTEAIAPFKTFKRQPN
jgi:hypothetical protein